MTRMRAPVLQRMKRRASAGIQGHDFAIHDNLIRLEAKARGSNPRIHGSQVLVVAGADLNVLTFFDKQRAVAIQFELVEPFGAFGQRLCGVGRYAWKLDTLRLSISCSTCHSSSGNGIAPGPSTASWKSFIVKAGPSASLMRSRNAMIFASPSL